MNSKLLVAGILFLCVVTVHSQNETGLNEDIDVTLVSVYITAVDEGGKFVTDLKSDDILLIEDGIPQQSSFFGSGAENLPLTVALLIDNSGSITASNLELARQAGLLILEEMKSIDKMLLVTFRYTTTAIVEPTFDKNRIRESLKKLSVQYGTTALFDAIHFAAGKLNQELGRKVMILFSDGQDNVSRHRLKDLLTDVAGSPDITIVSIGTLFPQYAISRYGMEKDYERGKKALQELSDSTGGYSVFPRDSSDLQQSVVKLRDFLRSQYTLAFSPSNKARNGSWRKIEIQCKRRNLRLLYRKGYVGPGERRGFTASSEDTESERQR